MKKTILFDLDGTLTDSGEGIINCAQLALEHFGLNIPSREEMRVFVGPPLHETFQKFGVPAEQVDEAIKIYRSRYIPIGKFENTPYPGIRELLETLVAHGHRLYVATSKPEAMSVEILEHFDLARYFTMICGATMDKSRSTKEAVIAYLLETNGKADDMIMVGDTAFDVIGAKAHGISTIGVSWGYGTVEDMEKAGAAAIAHNTHELLSLLEDKCPSCNFL
ncbi:MAG: HAD family hydrolase [Oscillospiraceae bacterium]|jgi:phosphoglycolate phosphatase|nr:HAD family hydrolase [Oscillospiraceae bacterium]